MFFNLAYRNQRNSRKENGILFVSLVISIIAFYIILSLENQDVILFLKRMESDAVQRLLSLMPVLYGMTLFLVFFLVYFTSKYQMERRSHEFGIYLVSGMRRSTLFGVLLAEDVLGSVWVLAAGIPLAVLLSEVVSLVTIRLVGFGIIGHHFTFSKDAVLYTILGFFAVKLAAFLILSKKVAGTELAELLSDTQEEKLRSHDKKKETIEFAVGGILLIAAYGAAIQGIAWMSILYFALTICAGAVGTFALFYGMSAALERVLGKRRKEKGLQTFNFRQLQENVILQPKVLAVSSLLVLAAVCCFGYGISVSLDASGGNSHVLDYTFEGEENEIRAALEEEELTPWFSELFEVRCSILRTEEASGADHSLNLDQVMEAAEAQPDSSGKEKLLNNLSFAGSPYMISLSGYNKVRTLAGKEPLVLENNQAALYNKDELTPDDLKESINLMLSEAPELLIDGNPYELTGVCETEAIVVDRKITLSFALIVTDEVFEALSRADDPFSYWNGVLSEEKTQENGLMQAIMEVNDRLAVTGLDYESYLQNMGRALFYVVASSYLTIYLAVIFLIIANTVIGVQFLMRQQKTRGRYQILMHLGCDYQALCRSARCQIHWFFGIPVSIAGISSIFGLRSLLTGLMGFHMQARDIRFYFIVGMAAVGLLCAAEFCYIAGVKRVSDRQMLEWMQVRREE